MAARGLVQEVAIETKGRGFIATKEINRGVLVFEEKPLAFAVCDGMTEKVCHECLDIPEKLYHCSKCNFSRYCGKHCQSLKAINEENPIRDLLSNPNETLRPELATEIRSNTFLFTQKYIDRELDIESFDQLAGQYRRNCFGLTDQGFIDVAATAMFSKFSLFNHSCCPNVYVSNVAKTMRARAIRPIRKGEELTINYVPDLMLGRMEYRQERIRVRYLFDCKCPACTSPEAIEKNKIHTRVRFQTTGKDVRQCIDECKRIEATARAQEKANNHASAIAIVDEFLKSSPLDRRSCYIKKIASLAQASCFELGMWERTLEFGDIVTESLKTFLSSDHPTLAQHYLALRTSLFKLGRNKLATQFTQIAVRSYEVFLGKDHPATLVYQRHLTGLLFQTKEFQEACRRGQSPSLDSFYFISFVLLFLRVIFHLRKDFAFEKLFVYWKEQYLPSNSNSNRSSSCRVQSCCKRTRFEDKVGLDTSYPERSEHFGDARTAPYNADLEQSSLSNIHV